MTVKEIPQGERFAISEEKLSELERLLDKLLLAAPCKGGPCLGHLNCEFAENGCYGTSCSIEDVQSAMLVTKAELINQKEEMQ